MKTTITGILFLLAVSSSQAAMQTLNDTELDAIQGQALITADYTTQNGIGFYKVGMQGTLEINANIRKLQLGCGGINGAGCDIDIDNFSLSGNCSTNRPSCDAVMKNPFIEFAIKNPGNSSQREIAGFRLSSDLLTGLMTAGTNDGTANGINMLSGYMQVAASSGTTMTAAGAMTDTLYGKSNVTVTTCVPFTSACTTTTLMGTNFHTDNRPLPVNSMASDFNTPAVTVNGSRLTSIGLTATTTIPDITVSGEKTAYIDCVLVVICLSMPHMNVTSTVHGLRANMNINEALGYIHSIPLSNPFSMSLQKQDILWPGQAAIARRGWWMSISDPINMGSMSTPADYRLDISSAYPQVASRVSDYLNSHPISVNAGDAVAGVLGFTVNQNIGTIDLSGYSPVSATFNNLPLGSAQNVTPNCWGTSRFC